MERGKVYPDSAKFLPGAAVNADRCPTGIACRTDTDKDDSRRPTENTAFSRFNEIQQIGRICSVGTAYLHAIQKRDGRTA